MRHLSPEPLQTECAKIVYLVCNQLELMKHISLHIHDNTSKGLQRDYFLYFVPRHSVACEQVLPDFLMPELFFPESFFLDMGAGVWFYQG